MACTLEASWYSDSPHSAHGRGRLGGQNGVLADQVTSRSRGRIGQSEGILGPSNFVADLGNDTLVYLHRRVYLVYTLGRI